MIIISQTPTDLPFVLSLRKQNHNQQKIYYIVIGRPSTYKILESLLNKKKKISYIDSFGSVGPKRLLSVLSQKLKLWRLFNCFSCKRPKYCKN